MSPNKKRGDWCCDRVWQVDSSWTKASKTTSYWGNVIFQMLKIMEKNDWSKRKSMPSWLGLTCSLYAVQRIPKYIWMRRWQFYSQFITEHCEFLASQWYILLNSDNLTPNSVSRSIFYSISDKKSQFFILCECIMFYHSLFVTPIGLQVFCDLEEAGIFQYLKQCK